MVMLWPRTFGEPYIRTLTPLRATAFPTGAPIFTPLATQATIVIRVVPEHLAKACALLVEQKIPPGAGWFKPLQQPDVEWPLGD